MAINQLAVYNVALQALGERSLDSTAENRATRRELDKVWAQGNSAISYALEQAPWNFATTRTTLNPSTGTTAAFEYTNAFDLPTDFVRLVELSTSSDMHDPLIKYDYEGSALLANSTIVYIRYVSDSTSYGNNLSAWPETFTNWLGHWLATQVYHSADQPKVPIDALQAKADRLLINARLKNFSAQQRPPKKMGPADVDHRDGDFLVELLPAMPRNQ